MKKFITFLVLLLFVGISISAEPTTPTKQRKDINLEQISIRGGKDYHRVPARHNNVECFYEDGYLHLTFEYPEGNATISITDIMDTPCLTQQFSTTVPFTLYIGEPIEPLNIKVTTEANIYTGMLIAL